MLTEDAVTCDRPLCFTLFSRYGRDDEELKRAAREACWHIPPCDCTWRLLLGYQWKHQRYYCPAHFPRQVKPVRDLPPLLPQFTVRD
jgi:hypothetical protein